MNWNTDKAYIDDQQEPNIMCPLDKNIKWKTKLGYFTS